MPQVPQSPRCPHLLLSVPPCTLPVAAASGAPGATDPSYAGRRRGTQPGAGEARTTEGKERVREMLVRVRLRASWVQGVAQLTWPC